MSVSQPVSKGSDVGAAASMMENGRVVSFVSLARCCGVAF